LNAIRSALDDRSIEVREKATFELGMLGVIVPASQPAVASILIPLLASREDPRIRVKAAWGMCYFGADGRRHPPGAGPDVVPALVAALDEPDVDVRRAAAAILGQTTSIAQGGEISVWDQRKDSIIPALDVATTDEDRGVREESALALFAFGRRDPVVIELIERAVDDPARSQNARFGSALRKWEDEKEAKDAVESVDLEDGAP
jgi:HEAT repeat protein